jgi:hypothetical protein
MPFKPVIAAALLALSLAACGNSEPKAGESCETEDTANCSSSTEALFCESSVYRAVPCRGPDGCFESTTQARCDISRARAGDPCPKSVAGKAQCDANNANQGLVCTNGVWTAEACRNCAVQGGDVVCF